VSAPFVEVILNSWIVVVISRNLSMRVVSATYVGVSWGTGSRTQVFAIDPCLSLSGSIIFAAGGYNRASQQKELRREDWM